MSLNSSICSINSRKLSWKRLFLVHIKVCLHERQNNGKVFALITVAIHSSQDLSQATFVKDVIQKGKTLNVDLHWYQQSPGAVSPSPIRFYFKCFQVALLVWRTQIPTASGSFYWIPSDANVLSEHSFPRSSYLQTSLNINYVAFFGKLYRIIQRNNYLN